MPVAYSYEEDVKADPRLAGLEPDQVRTFRPSPANMPKPGESRYLILHADKPSAFPEWENEPDSMTWGRGRGLPDMADAARFRLDARKSQITQPDIWPWMNTVYLITKRLLDLIVEFDPQAVDARPADYLFSDDLPPDEPYYLADFVRTIEAVDYSRSVTSYRRWSLELEAISSSIYPARAMLQVELPLALKSDIPEDVHIFRCEYGPGIFFSRAIIEEIVKRRFRRLAFWDPSIGGGQVQGDIITVDGSGELK